MAGLAGLPYYIQYQGQLQQQEAQKQQMAFQAFQIQQAQAAARRQQAAQQAAGQALPQLLAPPPAQQSQIPPPQPPMPGQASQPMTQPGQIPPMPQGAPQGGEMFTAGGSTKGMLSPGNIDLSKRPTVRNPDGSISTVRSMSVGIDGKEYLIPTVAADGSRILNPQEAIDQFKRTGQHLGVFDNPRDATAYAQSLHDQQAQMYGRGAAPQGQPLLPPYRALPTTPPPPPVGGGQAPAAISAPPTPQAIPAQQGGPLSFQRAVETLQAQGLEGADLMAGLAQLQPVLDTQAKLQNAQLQQQFNNEIKLAQVQQRKDDLQARLDIAKQASEDRRLSIEERRQAAAESRALRAETIALRKQSLAAGQGDDAKFTPEDLKFLAEQARAGDNTVYQNLGRGAQGAKNIIALRREVMKQTREAGQGGADIAAAQAGYQGEKAAARTAGTKAANVDLAVSEAQKTFPIVRELSAQLPRTQFPGVNRALQAAQTGTGDPRVIALGSALNTSVNAYARAISPSGTPTVSDKEHARELLNTASTPEQLDAVLKVMEKEMAAARQAPKEVKEAQRERISGRPAEAAPTAPAIPAGWKVTERP